MDLRFEHGSPSEPRGHAILYFWGVTDPSRVYATYVVVLPIRLDLVKYMPPVLAFQVPHLGAEDLSAFAIPPLPEEVASRDQVATLARVRGDDLLFGGSVEPSRVPDALAQVNEVVQAYARSVAGAVEESMRSAGAVAHPEASSGSSVSEVLYELMGEKDRLAELSRLVGRLRFAVEGSDARGAQEASEEVLALARYLPPACRIDGLLRAARTPTRAGGDLAQLYLERCYRLSAQEYTPLQALEERIRAMESGDQGP